MEDGRGSRRVCTGRRRSDGKLVPVVLDVTDDGYVAAFRSGADDVVDFDTREVSKMIGHLRDLQAIALRGVRWSGIQ